jgi:hypothetical protein
MTNYYDGDEKKNCLFYLNTNEILFPNCQIFIAKVKSLELEMAYIWFSVMGGEII